MGIGETIAEAAVETAANDYEIPAQTGGLPVHSILRRSSLPSIAIDIAGSVALGLLAGFAAATVHPGDVLVTVLAGIAGTAIGWDFFADRRFRALRAEHDRLKGWLDLERRMNARCRADGQAEIVALRRALAERGDVA
ncbi:hypothetical protein [Bradyrhizobium sp.]|uniref:hypothetical protein n=1 Tax=Bradyrhizobium sp. TaxID=376 RepID=UPI0025BB4F12|nr:hypothetical protein [Bradyrhizobium sp.]MCA3570682.1 hypothetical protein [Bradyrhizobium sp.]